MFFFRKYWGQSSDMKTNENTRSGHCSDAEPPCFLQPFCVACLQKPCVFYGRSGLIRPRCGPVDCRLGCRFLRNEQQNRGFWKHAQQNNRKNSWFCNGKSPGPCFFCIFLSLKRMPSGFSRFIWLPEGSPGVSPSWAKKWSCSYNNCISQEPFPEGRWSEIRGTS